MRILQLIDTLRIGGAERTAVNFANSLVEFGHESFLVTTREKGDFVDLLKSRVFYKHIKKKNTLDLVALHKLRTYIRENKIEIIHAHGTSWFFAVLSKLAGARIKIIWHNHFGDSQNMPLYRLSILKLFSSNFNGIISVNHDLSIWADRHLNCSKSLNLPNFVVFTEGKQSKAREFNNLVCLANLKPVKNHPILLKACDLVYEEIGIKLHIIGVDLNDSYSSFLIKEFEKRQYVIFHGGIIDPQPILSKMNIGILCSKSEGLPLALLEYGVAGLSVISTNVGACSDVIGDNGQVVSTNDYRALANSIKVYLTNKERYLRDSLNFKNGIFDHYSSEKVIPTYLEFCLNL
ncbi:glycosyltransferase [Gramella lutea]|uniref:Glycosyltransferase n=1 Tax=Christiangramia lutea TaxID=1607951 RepID=A0A9X1V254_9FLAO|nr:glycosyltransferase [Christiangramia lutea]MCH4821564.1 glycosyltransferase [Christiangramia lutea]